MANDGRPLLVLTGTTAAGKNRVGTRLAEVLNGEILVLDSMKVYRGMDVGTDKPDAELRARVPHHLVDVLDPSESMNLRRFVDLAHEVRQEIEARGRLPIVVGGTALYLNGLLRGVLDAPPSDDQWRVALRKEAEAIGWGALHERMTEVDPAAGKRIHPNDARRIERALEVHALTGKTITELQGQWKEEPALPFRLFVLTTERAPMYASINERVDRMMDKGLVAEVQRIQDEGGFSQEAAQALGYREVLQYLRGEWSLDTAVERIKSHTRRFSRRQLTWCKSFKEAVWLSREAGVGDDEMVARILDSYST